MNPSIKVIELSDLLIIAIPVVIVIAITWAWRLDYKRPIVGMGRMLLQLLLIGYVLVYIFAAEAPSIVMLVLGVMLVAASWISLGAISGINKDSRKSLLLSAFGAICLGGVSVLALVTQGVLKLDPWYQPQYMIPLAGMIFSYGMNAISLAAERLGAELEREVEYKQARNIAFGASMIPITNSLFAVGLVSLPGMMTGQILAGVSPFVAARYQILVMCMLFGATGIASATFLWLSKKQFIASNSI